MMNYVMSGILLGFVVGVFSFIFNYGHLLSSLLSLELLGLMVYWLMSLSVMCSKVDFFMLFYLVMVVCESVLGLSLLINSVYSYGSDYMKTYSMLSW
uniref:NADH-ubiquinone oxidoreductase chain 4L n=1 Tax=Gammarus roeselii TaxID=1080772 RepID=A0A343VUL9_9CRUS|nr:NADH dehydrogenase subunit 4L [Gammarus roeselii]AVP50041.1 NADH dehydrogenase subunit 4L [Gammarus roeselii]